MSPNRNADDVQAHEHLMEHRRRKDNYRRMLITSGRVKDYGHCIAINEKNAQRKAVRYTYTATAKA